MGVSFLWGRGEGVAELGRRFHHEIQLPSMEAALITLRSEGHSFLKDPTMSNGYSCWNAKFSWSCEGY
jgi:hypothetical protein